LSAEYRAPDGLATDCGLQPAAVDPSAIARPRPAVGEAVLKPTAVQEAADVHDTSLRVTVGEEVWTVQCGAAVLPHATAVAAHVRTAAIRVNRRRRDIPS
jgi:hypothetical protein